MIEIFFMLKRMYEMLSYLFFCAKKMYSAGGEAQIANSQLLLGYRYLFFFLFSFLS